MPNKQIAEISSLKSQWAGLNSEEAKRRGLIERVNEILRDRKFDGDLIENG